MAVKVSQLGLFTNERYMYQVLSSLMILQPSASNVRRISDHLRVILWEDQLIRGNRGIVTHLRTYD
jgi:hypothetical protein